MFITACTQLAPSIDSKFKLHLWYWKPEFSKCYYITGYKTWAEANEFCISLDPEAAVTSIRSKEENDYIQSLIMSTPDYGIRVWLGGRDEAEKGVWRWVNLSV